MPIQIKRPPADNADAPLPTLRLRRERLPFGRGASIRPPNRWYPTVKAAVEFLVALLLAGIALPLVALCALAIRLTSRGPAFYLQTRVGKGGRLFTICKLRTMVDNCESLTGPRWCIPGDPRVTRVGRFLRASHLDELPQLLNVLRGEMALIGPRPERPEFIPELERALPAYRQRLQVRPGVTGLAQIKLPADTDLNSVRRKLAHDLWYVERLGPWLDLRLLAGTALYAAGLRPRLVGLLVGIPDTPIVERSMHGVIGDTLPVRTRLSA